MEVVAEVGPLAITHEEPCRTQSFKDKHQRFTLQQTQWWNTYTPAHLSPAPNSAEITETINRPCAWQHPLEMMNIVQQEDFSNQYPN